MIDASQTPKWLRTLERRFGFLGIPNIAILLVTLQGLGFLMVLSDPIWILRLALVPERVLAGEYWRLITFLALPISSGLWMVFALLFMYFVVNSIESEWGSFKTTLYVATSYVMMVLFSFIFHYPITNVADLESSFFLAAAALFPEMEINFFFFIPAKMKWLAWLTGVFIFLHAFRGDWLDRLLLVAIYSNFLIFFGPAFLSRLHQSRRRAKFRNQMR